jgi:hypothetical protein
MALKDVTSMRQDVVVHMQECQVLSRKEYFSGEM